MKTRNKIIMAAIALCSILGTGASAQNTHNATTPQDPARVALPDSLKPLIIDTVLNNSTIYPSTSRQIQVMVPKQYDGSTPACLVVGLDGNLFNATTVIPNLINSGEMPVTIGILVQPGVTKDSQGNVVRYNRSNEFDRTDNRLATFLEQEVIPFIEGIKTPDGRPILLSSNPNDRAITGASSSGIAAFTVAWERPDLFARVYSSVGTFVAMRGGNEYPALIRKTEPKALRIFLQDGVNDTWNHIFGDWWEQNQLMASALNFAGYEFDYKWDRGSHSIYYGTRAYPDAMRWLWRGWPTPVQAGKSMNGMLKSLLVEGKGWEETTPYNQALVQKDDVNLVQKDNVNLKGEKYAVYPNGKMLVATEKNSNWLVSYLIAPDGSLHSGQQFYWLHNTDNHNHTEYGNIVFDTAGNLYIATPIGIQVCDQNGRVRAILPMPQGYRKVDQIAFIGNILYARCGEKWFKREVAHTGWNSWDAPIDIKSQGQG